MYISLLGNSSYILNLYFKIREVQKPFVPKQDPFSEMTTLLLKKMAPLFSKLFRLRIVFDF